ncbi:MAG: hypothetical protein KF887_08065 [Paracoccaceae bacterium]|nr:MAG: hypothetical protein KF887_08065 [Paracoccaceae bacterium]
MVRILTGGGITRRGLVAGAAAALAMPRAARAGLTCSGFTAPGPEGVQRCVAGLPALNVRGAGQLCPHWCWAACIQSLFATAGFVIRDQSRIVGVLFGRADLCLAANGGQIERVVNRDWQADDGRWFRAEAQTLLDLSRGLGNPNVVQASARDLANGYPLINGALGHATVMTAMTYLTDRTGALRGIEDITVADPLVPLGQAARQRSLTRAEQNNIFFVMQVRVYG